MDQLKICILKQDQIIRTKNAEISDLQSRVAYLEKERAELKRHLNDKKIDFTAVNCAVVDVGQLESR